MISIVDTTTPGEVILALSFFCIFVICITLLIKGVMENESGLIVMGLVGGVASGFLTVLFVYGFFYAGPSDLCKIADGTWLKEFETCVQMVEGVIQEIPLP